MSKKNKATKNCEGLIFLADINGFTRYLSSSSLKKSPERIARLLNGITESNTLGMKVAEIEGDAVFFYILKDKLPGAEALIDQCEKIYCNFQENLRQLDREIQENVIEENARKKLGIKIIMHYGEFTIVEMAGRKKPMGETVLVAHRLLKNSLQVEEYILITDECARAMFQSPERLQDMLWAEIHPGQELYEYIGIVNYFSCDLKMLPASKLQKV